MKVYRNALLLQQQVLFFSAFLFLVGQATWIDPDTPQKEYEIASLTKKDHRRYQLVFSDEFEVEGRRFDDGMDPRWTALNKNDYTNNPLHYYSHDAVQSKNGSLSITLSMDPRDDLVTINLDGTEYKEFKTGMVQSWQKFCFTGGIVEFTAKMPGEWLIGGLWPAIWLMGNLGRATFVSSTENMWPFSTNVCDDRTRNSQLLNSCRGGPQFPGIPRGRGRGAPEIDLFEVMYLDDYFTSPVLSTSLQVAPGVPEKQRPVLGHSPNTSQIWYSPEYGENVTRNTYFYGTISYPADPTKKAYRTDSISANFALNKDFYDNFHKFRIEWEPPEESGSGGYVKWFIDDRLITAIDGDDLFATSHAEIPSEPMYLVMNMAVSKDWGFPDAYFKNCPKKCWSCLDPDCACGLPRGFCDNMPTSFEIGSVRVYQPVHEPKYTLGCSPPDRPTAEFIEANNDVYKLVDDAAPLKDVLHGGASCHTNEDCGTVRRGHCNDSLAECVCGSGWTGPSCLASVTSSPTKSERGVPSSRTGATWSILLVFIIAAIAIAVHLRRSQTRMGKDRGLYQVLISTDVLEAPRDTRRRNLDSYQES